MLGHCCVCVCVYARVHVHMLVCCAWMGQHNTVVQMCISNLAFHTGIFYTQVIPKNVKIHCRAQWFIARLCSHGWGFF